MMQEIARAFEDQVADLIRDLGYTLVVEPSKVPIKNIWQIDPAYLIRGLKYKPDFLVERDEDSVIVETKVYPVLLGGVIQVRQYADYFSAKAVLCVPDNVSPEIPKSVREFAGQQGVRLCSLEELEEVLADLLQ